MQVSVESISNLERKMTVQLPAEKIDSEVESRIRSMAPRVQIKGFRPGKVPLKVVRQQYGKGVYQEVLGELMQSSFQEAVTQEKLQPAGAPSIDSGNPEPGAELKYTATFEIYPEIEIQDLAEKEIAQLEVKIEDADIDKMIDTLREQHKGWKEVKRAAKKGDQVIVDFEGFMGDEAFEGGKASNAPIVIGQGGMIPGFEEQLTGVKGGDEKTLNVTFPEGYGAKNLAGKEARFETKVISVSAPELPKVDKDFVAKFGVDDGSIDKFRDDVKSNMLREGNQAIRQRVKTEVMDILLAAHADVEAPKALVGQEIENLRQQMMSNAGQSDASMFPDDLFEAEGKKRVLLGLIVGKIIRDNDIRLDSDRVDVTLDELATTYEDPEQFRQYYRSSKERLATIEAMVIEEQVVDWIKSKADVSTKEIGFDELMNTDNKEEG